MTTVNACQSSACGALPLEETGRVLGLIFDCDGVLFDSKSANTAYYNHIRFSVNLPPMNEDEASYSHMVSAEEALERIIPEALKPAAFEVRDKTRYHDSFMPMMQPSPFVYDCLQGLRDQGIPLALCTNRSDSVHHVLTHFGMDCFFNPVMTITHARPKPDPQGLADIVSRWNFKPGSVAFVGDSLVDQQAAEAAGIPFWSFNSPDLRARLHLSSFRELFELMRMMYSE